MRRPHTLQLECETLNWNMNVYIEAKVLFKFGSLERLYVEMRQKSYRISGKFGGLVPNIRFRNTCGYRHTYIRTEEILAEYNLVVSWSISQTDKFLAVQYSNCHITNTCEG